MDTAHEEPNMHMARLVPGQQAPRLPPIAMLLEVETEESFEGFSNTGGAYGASGLAGGLSSSGLGLSSGFGPMLRVQGSSTESGSSVSAVEDARNMAQNLMDSLRHSQLPYGYDPQPLLTALHRYSELLWVLSGRRPSELLPPAPPSYIATRVRQLAKGSCVKAFNWNGGEEHGGSPWSPELPTDSALLLYLFAAFLDAPGWQFPLQGSGPDSGRCASKQGCVWWCACCSHLRQYDLLRDNLHMGLAWASMEAQPVSGCWCCVEVLVVHFDMCCSTGCRCQTCL
eukprot:GHRQ01024286.1.p1 GENE.GHRQ01024286.1~~GHRQ01024286.1.p1  ORF type:complete len:284 (+),score=78.69 GHRQ01024286.1:605-1456(+)